ncbi:MAG: hypothetical protein WBI17_01330 [Clostridiaceae bacterium]
MLAFKLSPKYKGNGVSEGLDRGLLVYWDGELLLEEGMGIGACAVQQGGFTHFGSLKSFQEEGARLEAVYSMNKKLIWTLFGIPSKFITRIMDYSGTNLYMNQERLQDLFFKVGTFFFKVFQMKVSFAEILPIGEVHLVYEVGDSEVFVNVSCKTKKPDCKIFVMNELGGNLFNQGMIKGMATLPPPGWQRVPMGAELFSPLKSLAFKIIEFEVPQNIESTIYWGREISKEHQWAGFESEIMNSKGDLVNYRYSIKFREVYE